MVPCDRRLVTLVFEKAALVVLDDATVLQWDEDVIRPIDSGLISGDPVAVRLPVAVVSGFVSKVGGLVIDKFKFHGCLLF